MPTDPIEFSRTLANDDQQRCGNRVQLEDENAGAINAANPLPTTANIAGLADPLPVTLEDAAGNAAGVAGNPLQVGDAGGSITVDQAAHDNLNANTNLQVANTDVSAANPVPTDSQGNTITVAVTPTISAAVIYASGDAIGGRLDLANAVRAGIGTGTITSIVIVDNDQEQAPIDIVFFDQAFAATADNSPFDPSDADLANCIGFAAIAATDYANFNDNAVACKRNIGLWFELASGVTTLFAQMVVRATPTYTATSDLTVKVTIAQD